MTKKLNEWEAWVFLAMNWDSKTNNHAGICGSVVGLTYDAQISPVMESRMIARLDKNRPKGKPYSFEDYWWEPDTHHAKRANYCWLMAEKCDEDAAKRRHDTR
ncbi:MAG: hypothetical protein ACXAEN_19335 [Candidatus Thorarchaeota archaeon]|jgi:hypothetical protein